MLGTLGQSIAIMGQKLGEAELARADVVIRPQVLEIGSADFAQRASAILEGEKAARPSCPGPRADCPAAGRARPRRATGAGEGAGGGAQGVSGEAVELSEAVGIVALIFIRTPSSKRGCSSAGTFFAWIAQASSTSA